MRDLGFAPMVTAPYLWAWNRDMQESFMVDYSYEALVDARDGGVLTLALT